MVDPLGGFRMKAANQKDQMHDETVGTSSPSSPPQGREGGAADWVIKTSEQGDSGSFGLVKY